MSGLESKFLGSMIGSALGDAIGELAFRFPEESSLRRALDRVPILQYTDDTAMAIGLAESLVEIGGVDENHLGETFRRNFEKEPWRGYASGPPEVFSLVRRRGLSYPEAAGSLFSGQGSYGNGAAMRVGPVGLFFCKSDSIIERARASAQVTHSHPVGMDGASIQAMAVALAVNWPAEGGFSRRSFCGMLTEASRTEEIREKMKLVQRCLDSKEPPSSAARSIGKSVAVHESMPFAVYSFLRYPGSFPDCIGCSVLNGGDRDTLGAMAGAISGAYLGREAIPESWLLKLENRSHIEGLALTLAKMVADLWKDGV